MPPRPRRHTKFYLITLKEVLMTNSVMMVLMHLVLVEDHRVLMIFSEIFSEIFSVVAILSEEGNVQIKAQIFNIP